MVERIPESEWVWCGYAGHFIGASECLMHMHTRVGDYRISTVGDYYPNGVCEGSEARNIGSGRKFETFVFRVQGDGEHGEGEVVEWSEIDTDAYNKGPDAERGHMQMCRKYAALVSVPA